MLNNQPRTSIANMINVYMGDSIGESSVAILPKSNLSKRDIRIRKKSQVKNPTTPR